jgi:hypothetical protein
MNTDQLEEEGQLVLAAEECSDELFPRIHRFSSFEERVIRSLIAHGPVLLRGGRGSGKSTLMREAANRLKNAESKTLGIYLSLRYLQLLRESGAAYESYLIELICSSVNDALSNAAIDGDVFTKVSNGGDLQRALASLATKIDHRIVLLFDDAAHLGRENSSSEFFDIFRTISSRSVSCKAAIYPGVTNFGKRFDVFNDATVVDVSRDEASHDFAGFFFDVLNARYPKIAERFGGALKAQDAAAFLGRAVLGNMRAFVFACNRLNITNSSIGMPELTRCLIDLCAEYFWPLLEEVQPKLGRYEPLVDTSKNLAVAIFQTCAENKTPSVIIHRDFCQAFAKPFEILEYAGFISRREASRALKKGGRGPRYAVNLANLLEVSAGARLTQDLFKQWLSIDRDFLAEIQRSSSVFSDITMPPLPEYKELGILESPISALAKGSAYPYGLTPKRLEVLMNAGYTTVGQVAAATDEALTALPWIKEATLPKIRAVLSQAIWM